MRHHGHPPPARRLARRAGPHVHQTGSLVAPDRLRFDFSHGDPLTPQQRLAVQGRINEAIRRNLPVRTDVMPVDEAMRSGAVALFDERYGDTVRVLTIGDVSKELCAGRTSARRARSGSSSSPPRAASAPGRGAWRPSPGPAEDFVNRQLDTLEHVARTLEVPPRKRRRGCSACKGSWRRPAGAWKGRASWPSRACRRSWGRRPRSTPPGGRSASWRWRSTPRRADDGAFAGGGGLAAGQAGRTQRPAPGLRPQRQPAAPGHGEQGPHRAGPARRAAAQ